jgi:hypothetical protein
VNIFNQQDSINNDSKTLNSVKINKRFHENRESLALTSDARVDGRLGEISQQDYDMLSEHLVLELTGISQGLFGGDAEL